MSEKLQASGEYCEVFGNTGIMTPFGKLNIAVNPLSIKQELIAVANAYYPKNNEAQKTGRQRAGKLVCIFGGVPFGDVLLPRFEKTLTNNGVLKAIKDQTLKESKRWAEKYDYITASSFVNPLDQTEYIFYFNLPLFIKNGGIVDINDLAERFRTVWVHERYHFAQFADTKRFAERMARENGSIEKIMFAYLLSVPALSGWIGLKAANKVADSIEKSKHGKLSRRGFLQGIGGVLGLAAGAKVVGDTYSLLGYNLQYNILPTFEHEAVDATKKSVYTTSDLQQTFGFELA